MVLIICGKIKTEWRAWMMTDACGPNQPLFYLEVVHALHLPVVGPLLVHAQAQTVPLLRRHLRLHTRDTCAWCVGIMIQHVIRSL